MCFVGENELLAVEDRLKYMRRKKLEAYKSRIQDF